MDKLKMQSENLVDANVEKIASLFPNCVTESMEDGKLAKKVDFDLLRQELSNVLVEGKDERYRLDWAGKRQAILTANSPIAKTLRPVVADEKKPTGADSSGNPYLSSGSVGKDGTPGKFDSENLYIEGDNLDVLKLLHETYLNKVKMIYIDPPYNTGNDFVYNDDFAVDSEEYLAMSNQTDEQGNRMTTNKETSGRYHSHWLSMMYMRLKLAKDLLTDDGVIFISIDDNEQHNLRKICDEIFGEENFVTMFNWQTKKAAQGMTTQNMVVDNTEYFLVYIRDNGLFKFKGLNRNEKSGFSNPDNDSRGPWKRQYLQRFGQGLSQKTIKNPANGMSFTFETPYTQEKLDKWVREDRILFPKALDKYPARKEFLFEYKNLQMLVNSLGLYATKSTTEQLYGLFDDDKIFTNPKPDSLIKFIVGQSAEKNSVILDFFSGSATTAHAVMSLNAEDGGNRKFIMVQLPENTEENSEAYKAGYKNICEIGKERIRRAGEKIKGPNSSEFLTALHRLSGKDAVVTSVGSNKNTKTNLIIEKGDKLTIDGSTEQIKETEYYKKFVENLDTGFRVLKLDDSNMKDVYYNPREYNQSMLLGLDSSIKEDRTAEDILFQVMLDKGVSLSSKIEKKATANGEQSYYIVGETSFGIIDLICCLDKKVNTDAVKEIAKLQPECCVFLDSGMENDATRTNIQQIFDTYSPKTKVEVL